MANRQHEQQREKSSETPGPNLHATAARGVAGHGAALPFRDQIQHSFGHHDIGGVRAHLGGAASEANAAMGSRGYATGRDVAFAGAPDLHTAAHEAAHVIQQRAGVHLAGGIGAAGDRYEQHADAVADAVVAGRSAESLLDRYAGGGATHAVQHRYVQYNGREATSAQATSSQATSSQVTSSRPTSTSASGRSSSGPAQTTSVAGNRADTARQLGQHIATIQRGYTGEVERHRALWRLRYNSGGVNRLVGAVSETVGRAGDLPPASMWDAVRTEIQGAEAALAAWSDSGGRESGSDAAMRRFQGHIRAAERHFRANVARLQQYQERTEDGAEQSQETLTGVVAACAAAIVVAGATIGAAAGTAAVASGATTSSVMGAASAATTGAVATGGATTIGSVGGTAMGTGIATAATTATFGAAERGGEMATGQRDNFDFAGLMRQTGQAALTAMTNAIIGGAMSGLFAGAFTRIVIPAAQRAGLPAVVTWLQGAGGDAIRSFLADTAQTCLTTAIERARAARAGNPSREGFVEEVVRQMLQDQLMQLLQRRILHRVDARNAARNAAPNGPAAGDTPAAPASTPAPNDTPASRFGPGSPEPARTRAPANTPTTETRATSSRFGPGSPEPARTRAPANTPTTETPAASSRFGPGSPEPGRTRAPANASASETGAIEGYTRDQRPVRRNTQGRAVTDDGTPVTETWIRSGDGAAVHSDGAVTPQRRGPDASTEPMAGGGASVAERHLDAARSPAGRSALAAEQDFWQQNDAAGAPRHRGASITHPFSGPSPNASILNREGDSVRLPGGGRQVNLPDGAEMRQLDDPAAVTSRPDFDPMNPQYTGSGTGDNTSYRVPLANGGTGTRVETGTSVTTPNVPPGQPNHHVLATTGLNGCSGIGTVSNGPSGQRLSLAHSYGEHVGQGQLRALHSEIYREINRGSTDIRSMMRVAPHHLDHGFPGRQTSGGSPAPADVSHATRDAIATELNRSLNAGGTGPRRTAEVSGDQIVVTNPQGDVVSRVRLDVILAPLDANGNIVDQQMTVSAHGTTVRDGDSADGRGGAYPW